PDHAFKRVTAGHAGLVVIHFCHVGLLLESAISRRPERRPADAEGNSRDGVHIPVTVGSSFVPQKLSGEGAGSHSVSAVSLAAQGIEAPRAWTGGGEIEKQETE